MLAGVTNLTIALILHSIFLIFYISGKIRTSKAQIITEVIKGSWGIFLFLVFELIAAIDYKHISSEAMFTIIFLIISAAFYFILLHQKAESNS